MLRVKLQRRALRQQCADPLLHLRAQPRLALLAHVRGDLLLLIRADGHADVHVHPDVQPLPDPLVHVEPLGADRGGGVDGDRLSGALDGAPDLPAGEHMASFGGRGQERIQRALGHGHRVVARARAAAEVIGDGVVSPVGRLDGMGPRGGVERSLRQNSRRRVGKQITPAPVCAAHVPVPAVDGLSRGGEGQAVRQRAQRERASVAVVEHIVRRFGGGVVVDGAIVYGDRPVSAGHSAPALACRAAGDDAAGQLRRRVFDVERHAAAIFLGTAIADGAARHAQVGSDRPRGATAAIIDGVGALQQDGAAAAQALAVLDEAGAELHAPLTADADGAAVALAAADGAAAEAEDRRTVHNDAAGGRDGVVAVFDHAAVHIEFGAAQELYAAGCAAGQRVLYRRTVVHIQLGRVAQHDQRIEQRLIPAAAPDGQALCVAGRAEVQHGAAADADAAVPGGVCGDAVPLAEEGDGALREGQGVIGDGQAGGGLRGPPFGLAQGDVLLEDDLRLATGGVDRQRGLGKLGRRIHLVTGGLSRLCRRQERKEQAAGKKGPQKFVFQAFHVISPFFTMAKGLTAYIIRSASEWQFCCIAVAAASSVDPERRNREQK